MASDDQTLDSLIQYLRSLGVTNLADEISEERFARRILEGRVNYDYWMLQSEIWKDRHDKALESAVSLQASLYDKAASYNNVVITLGYAGFFSVWNLVSEELSRNENALVALLLGSSLLVFVCWTLLNSLFVTLNFKRYASILNQDFQTFDEELEAHRLVEDKTKRSVLRLQRFWPAVFLISALTGLLAGLLVMTELFLQISGIELNFAKTFWGLCQ